MPETEYGPKYKDHLLEQYKIFVNSAEKISDRRQNANNHFLTLNAALISLLGLSSNITVLNSFEWVKILIAFVGIVICSVYWLLLRSYKQINSKKFGIIHEVEKQLPLKIYDHEWHALAKGRKWYVYFPFSHVEMFTPGIFGFVYWTLGWLFFLN